MKKSVEMRRQLDELKNQVEILKEEGKIDEAHSKLAEIKNLRSQIEIQEELEIQESYLKLNKKQIIILISKF